MPRSARQDSEQKCLPEAFLRVSGGHSPQFVYAREKLLDLSRTVAVVKAGTTYELLAANPMGELLMASPAISGGALYVRG